MTIDEAVTLLTSYVFNPDAFNTNTIGGYKSACAAVAEFLGTEAYNHVLYQVNMSGDYSGAVTPNKENRYRSAKCAALIDAVLTHKGKPINPTEEAALK